MRGLFVWAELQLTTDTKRDQSAPPCIGFAPKPPVFLKPGDVVEVEIEKIEILSSRPV